MGILSSMQKCIQRKIIRLCQCPIWQFFEGAGFLTNAARRKSACAADKAGSKCGDGGGCSILSPDGFRGEAPNNFGYFAFWVAQSIALVALIQRTVTKAYNRNQHFWEFGDFAFGISHRYAGFKIALDTALFVLHSPGHQNLKNIKPPILNSSQKASKKMLENYVNPLPALTQVHPQNQSSYQIVMCQLLSNGDVAPWRSGYHYCTTSFIIVWTQVLHRFKSCSRCVGDLQWWRSLTVVPAENKATSFVSQPYHKINSSS